MAIKRDEHDVKQLGIELADDERYDSDTHEELTNGKGEDDDE